MQQRREYSDDLETYTSMFVCRCRHGDTTLQLTDSIKYMSHGMMVMTVMDSVGGMIARF